MRGQYSGLEILKLAISMEQEGVQFYQSYAQKAEGEMKQELLRLAEDEKKHEDTFKKMYQRLEEQYSTENGDYLFLEEVDQLFRSLAAEKGFAREQKELGSTKEVLETGIETEKTTIQLYEKMLEYANEETKQILKRLIKEEKSHQHILERHLAQLG
ncbi:MAG: ferritin family protein [Epulopiscium sp.]|nr:ferritin family protein [Candidatus Epulonipiscium sp.]